jgi:hypothetical protein
MAVPAIVLPLLVIAAAACPRAPPVRTLVIAGKDPVSVATDLTLAEIRELAKQANRVAAHSPYGFYLGGVAVAIEVDIGNETHDACLGPIDIRVTLKLTDRHIEVAQELRDDPCKFAKVVAHYQRHAEADGAVFDGDVMRVTTTLSHTPAASFVADLAAGSGRKQIALAVQSIIKPALTAMHVDRASVPKMVDTPAEMNRLEKACTNAPGDQL